MKSVKLLLIIALNIIFSLSAQAQGENINTTIPITEFLLDDNGDVIKRSPAEMKLYRNSQPGAPYSYVLFITSPNYNVLCEYNRTNDVRVCRYDISNMGDMGTGWMLSNIAPTYYKDQVDIIRVSDCESDGTSYLSYERYDTKTGKSKTPSCIWELDNNSNDTFRRYFLILVDSFNASEINTISKNIKIEQ